MGDLPRWQRRQLASQEGNLQEIAEPGSATFFVKGTSESGTPIEYADSRDFAGRQEVGICKVRLYAIYAPLQRAAERRRRLRRKEAGQQAPHPRVTRPASMSRLRLCAVPLATTWGSISQITISTQLHHTPWARPAFNLDGPTTRNCPKSFHGKKFSLLLGV